MYNLLILPNHLKIKNIIYLTPISLEFLLHQNIYNYQQKSLKHFIHLFIIYLLIYVRKKIVLLCNRKC